ncbi:hypothetical protein AAC387_Pa06g2239 [Persea americana]
MSGAPIDDCRLWLNNSMVKILQNCPNRKQEFVGLMLVSCFNQLPSCFGLHHLDATAFISFYMCASYLDASGMLYPRCPPKRRVGGAQYMQKHSTNFSEEFALVAATNFSVQSSLHFRFVRIDTLKRNWCNHVG